MSPADLIPPRADASTKLILLEAIADALAQGAAINWACEVLGLDERRYRRWYQAHTRGVSLDDGKPGAMVNAITPEEIAAILDAFEVHGLKDFSHRRLAHRGSYEGLFWASPSTVERVLNTHHLRFRHPPRPVVTEKRPYPEWASYTKNSIWIFDTLCRRRHNVSYADLLAMPMGVAFVQVAAVFDLWKVGIVRGI